MLPEGFKPNLAISSDKVVLQPEVRFVSEKLDGIRVCFFGGVAYSRSLKPLPNKVIQDIAKLYADVLEGCDGEIIAGDKYAKDVLQRSNSFCMSDYKIDDFKIYLFDRFDAKDPEKMFVNRYVSLFEIQKDFPKEVEILPHFKVKGDRKTFFKDPNEVDLAEFEQEILSKGGEGCIVRDAFGTYKFGRSGTKTPGIQKLKRFIDDEFLVVGYTQFESNQNEAKVNELGRTARSSSKEGKVLVEKLGSLILETKQGIRFNCGTGFTDEDRLALWEIKDTLDGKLAKVKFFHYSKDNVPLLPVFICFRNSIDL